MYEFLTADTDSLGICTVTLTRPPVNAVTSAMYIEIRDCFESINTDLDVACVVLTGAGDRVFCAGNDLHEFTTMDVYNADERMRIVRQAFFAVYDCAVPVVGAINGHAIGTGFGLAANCDVLFASDNATFCLPEINVGILGGGAFGTRMTNQFVMRRMFFSGTPISAADMAHYGAVTEVVSAAQLMPTAHAFAANIAAKPREAVRLAKFGLNLCEGMNLKDGYALEQSFTARLAGYPVSKQALQTVIDGLGSKR